MDDRTSATFPMSTAPRRPALRSLPLATRSLPADLSQESVASETRTSLLQSYRVPERPAWVSAIYLHAGDGRTSTSLPSHDFPSFDDVRVDYDPPDPRANANPYPNAIKTTRFTLMTWLPVSLFLQFQRSANCYFLLVAILASTPLWEASGAPKVVVLVFILAAQAIKDLVEDLKRGRDDRTENNRSCELYDLKNKGFEFCMWKECRVGSLVFVKEGEIFPADILVLATDEPSGRWFVSTKSLDGETNLKVKKLPEATIMGRNLVVKLQRSSKSLFEMEGELEVQSGSLDTVDWSMPLSMENFALRGCVLENTAWVCGVACFVNGSTKVRLNATAPPSKSSELSRYLNRFVSCIICLIFVLSTTFSLLSLGLSPKVGFWRPFVRYLIILYPVVPMTLYIMFEALHVVMGRHIDIDLDMEDPATETPAQVRNTSILEELGQVNDIFSDKTGTLTANEMRFAECCIGIRKYGPFIGQEDYKAYADLRAELKSGMSKAYQKDSAFAVAGGSDSAQTQTPMANLFFEMLAICHEVNIGRNDKYQGTSPDEVALVQAAHKVGYSLVRSDALTNECCFPGRGDLFNNNDARNGIRGREIKQIATPNGSMQHSRVLYVIPFSSDRKRMSVVYTNSNSNGNVMLVTKGADVVMEKSLLLPEGAREKLNSFARAGLRTLVIGYRQMTSIEYTQWESRRIAGGVDRKIELEAELERGLTYVGITALEDKLQDGVPETIANLRSAGVRIWVLTGDKIETAVEIAKMCKLFTDDVPVYIRGSDDVSEQIERALAQASEARGSKGMVLDGSSMETILTDPSKCKALYDLANNTNACVACRLSPMQKAELVKLVCEQNSKAITLAIGDGANDVPMIQAAHIGIGIAGKEGYASVQASDIAISQFRFLANLLFCHGRKAYRRLAIFLNFFVYKGIVLGCCYVIFAHIKRFSGDMMFATFLDDTYNGVTTLGVSVLLLSDRDIADSDPSAFKSGPQREHFNFRIFVTWMFFACIHGCMAWVIPWLVWPDNQNQSTFIAFTNVVVVIHWKLFVIAAHSITFLGVVAVLTELLFYIPVVVVLSLLPKLSPEFYHQPWSSFVNPENALESWCLVAAVPALSVLPDILYELVKRRLRHSRRRRTEALRSRSASGVLLESRQAE